MNRDAYVNGFQPAFPATESHGLNSPMSGLTKREKFAMAALQGLTASPAGPQMIPEQAAAIAVTLADCLLAELERRA